jgi:ferric-dicitrate binding protein FerR (iron transport regulator)
MKLKNIGTMSNIEDNTIIKYITGKATPGEIQQVEAWLRQSEENRDYFMYYEEIWKNSPTATMPGFDTSAAWDKVNARIENNAGKKSKMNLGFLKMAASVIIVLGAGYLAYMLFAPGKAQIELATVTTAGTKKEITLSDGTRVWLNRSSTLTFPEEFTGNTREVKLEGEAFFDVTGNPRQPFIVKTGNSYTKVLGTRFNVRARYKGITEVAVEEGKVALAAGDPAKENIKVTLTAGDKGKYARDKNELTKTKIESMNYDAWRTGILKFQNTDLKTAIEDIGSYYEVDIRVENEELKGRVFTSTFEDRSLDEVLKILELTLDVEITGSGKRYTITK